MRAAQSTRSGGRTGSVPPPTTNAGLEASDLKWLKELERENGRFRAGMFALRNTGVGR